MGIVTTKNRLTGEDNMSYNLYKTKFETAKNNYFITRELKKLYGKNNYSFRDFINLHKKYCILHEQGEIDLGHDKPHEYVYLMLEEAYWESKGRQVVFIENMELFQSLKSSKFDNFNNIDFDFPYKTFSICFPSGCYLSGMEVKSCLVSIMTARELLKIWEVSNNDYSEKCLDRTHINVYTTMRCGDIRSIKLDTEDLTQLNNKSEPGYELFKFVLKLFAYHSATEGKKLVKGFPKSCIIAPKDKKLIQYKPLRVKSTNKKHEKIRGGKKIKYRVPYFRNLKADRYYKGDYQNCKKGSRWVFVREVNESNSINSMLN